MRIRPVAPLASFAVLALLPPVQARDLPDVRKAGRLEAAVVGGAAFETDVLRGFARAIGAQLASSSAESRAGDASIQLGVTTGARDSVVFLLRGADAGLRDALNAHVQGLRGSQAWGMLMSRHLGGGVIEALAKASLADSR